MGKKYIRTAAGFTAIALAASLWLQMPAKAAPSSEQEALDAMVQVAENDSLILYMDEEDTDIAVYVKETGDIWFGNPPDAENDMTASDYYRRQMKSQIFLRYFNESVQENSMDNYSDAIRDGQFSVEYLEDGVTITYMMGDNAAALLLPEVISVDRMEQFTAQMETAAAKKVLRNYTKISMADLRPSETDTYVKQYPGLVSHDIYVLRSSVKDYIREELAGYMEAAGYTEEELAFDKEDNGYESEDNKPWFSVPLTYRLDGENLIVEVDPETISYNQDNYYLVDVELMPYFGAAGTQEEGYIFVPDGCGALIYLNNGSTASSYGAMVYGQDMTMSTLTDTKSKIDQSLTVKMPVFGLKSGEKAWFAVIKDGDGYADISASVSGQTTSYNTVRAGFQYLQYGSSSLGSMVGSNSFQMYSPPSFSGNYRLRYAFLSGADADYSGMAREYQAYLAKKGVLGERTDSTEVPFFAEYIGAIDKYTTFFGIKHRSIYPVTTYWQAQKITRQIQSVGVKNINVIYSGWANGGLHGKAYTDINAEKKLEKGGVNRKKFLQEMTEQGVNVFLTVEMQYVYRDKMFDGYSPLRNAPKYFDRSPVQAATYFLDTNTADKEHMIDLISPRYAGQVSTALSKQAANLKGAGLNMGSISCNLYTDQLEGNYTDRQAAIGLNRAAAEALAASYDGKLMGDNANVYMLGTVGTLINAPMDSNRYLIIDEVVPFYEMVLHGYMDYAGDCLNMTDDYRTALLRSVESGAGLYFKWMYEDNSIVKETDFDDLYSVNYSAWIDTALEDYKRVNDTLGALQGETIVKHEFISEKVVRVTYEKGTQIVVNYSPSDVTVDGVKVDAMDYAVVKRHG